MGRPLPDGPTIFAARGCRRAEANPSHSRLLHRLERLGFRGSKATRLTHASTSTAVLELQSDKIRGEIHDCVHILQGSHGLWHGPVLHVLCLDPEVLVWSPGRVLEYVCCARGVSCAWPASERVEDSMPYGNIGTLTTAIAPPPCTG